MKAAITVYKVLIMKIFCSEAPKPAKRPTAEVKAKKEPEEPVKKVETVPAPAPTPTPSPAQLIQAEYQQLVLVSIVSLLILFCVP
jgi:hypothetical protein